MGYLHYVLEQTNIPYIMEYFEVSKKEATDYYDIMEKINLKLLLKKFGKSDKEIKKMGVK